MWWKGLKTGMGLGTNLVVQVNSEPSAGRMPLRSEVWVVILENNGMVNVLGD